MKIPAPSGLTRIVMKIPVRWLAVVISTLAALLLPACSTIQTVFNPRDPEITITEVDVQTVNIDSIELRVDVRVHNPNPIALDLSGYEYSLYVGQNEALSGSKGVKVTLPAQGASRLNVPVTIGLPDVAAAATGLAHDGGPRYTIEMTARIAFPVISDRLVTTTKAGELSIP